MSDGNNGNKVWVKWFDGKLNGMDEVKGLAEGACIRDLLEAFVNQQNYRTTSPGTLNIFESEAATEPLRRNISLKDYFECSPPNGPGTDYDAPLVVKFQLAPVAVVPAPSVMDIAEVNALLDELMKSWDVQAPQLEPFPIQEDAVLYPYLRTDINDTEPIPSSPNGLTPSLLLHDLQNGKHTEREAYKYIHHHQLNAPIGLFAVSGAGKTRTIFEYLSHNFGFFFVADTKNNPGSMDFSLFLQRCQDLKKCKAKEEAELQLEQSEANLYAVRKLLISMLCVRQAVFTYVDRKFRAKSANDKEEGLTPYGWLLLQLYPSEFLGCDIFQDLLRECLKRGGCEEMAKATNTKQRCFVDEAQLLNGMMTDRFVSSKGDEKRSIYSAIVKGLCYWAVEGSITYPCFSGTGLSLDMCAAETKSVMVKPATHEDFFSGLDPMSAEHVAEYMKSFLCFELVGKDLLKHVAEWLRGRPRWTASFLETFLVRKNKATQEEPRGRFQKAELPLVKALYRYIEVLTLPKTTGENPRNSWSMADGTSAFDAIDRIFLLDVKRNRKAFDLQNAVYRATFEFMMSGQSSLLENASMELVENGVAAVRRITKSNDGKTTYIEAFIDEPLIVQAGVNYFGLNKSATEKFASAKSPSEQGTAFEQFILPSIQQKFCEVLQQQAPKNMNDDFIGFDVPKWTSYGVLVLDVRGDVSKALTWVQQSMAARFEGTIAPFCYPDTKIGPDVLFFLRTYQYYFRLVASQVKFRNEADQLHALRTITPEKFYYQERGFAEKLNTTLTAEQKQLWKSIKATLFKEQETSSPIDTGGRRRTKRNKESQLANPPVVKRRRRTNQVIRFVIQYADATASAIPGPIAFGHEQNKCKPGCACTKHDVLVCIDRKNADTLLGSGGARMMELVKKQAN